MLWQSVFPGHTDVQLWPDPDEGVIYHTAAWGLAYAAIRLRKMDARTGAQLATARLAIASPPWTFPPIRRVSVPPLSKSFFAWIEKPWKFNNAGIAESLRGATSCSASATI